MKAWAVVAALTAALGLAVTSAAPTAAQTSSAQRLVVAEGDHVVRGFRFASGERLPELRLHYRTLGTPRRDAQGRVTNAVLWLHGTGGSGAQFLRPQFADVLLTPGGPLDPADWYVILPDSIGHGGSSKPSDGLRARFPRYDYTDMVAAQHALLTQGLRVDRLRLLAGTSMGCMHAFVWGETHPDFAQALLPLACQPSPITGRNRMWRKLAMDAIRADPAWRGGDYTAQPVSGLRTAAGLLALAGMTPEQAQLAGPTRDAADAWVTERMDGDLARLDANDLLYQLDSSRTYDPSEGLERITAPTILVNSADDFINPPEVGTAEALMRRAPNGRYVLLPTGPDTRGHGSHTWAVLWRAHLEALLRGGPLPPVAAADAERAFLRGVAAQPGVVTLPGLSYRVLRSGPVDGRLPTRADSVTVRYEGRFTDGRVFSTSADGGRGTSTFALQALIPAWLAGVRLMRPGDEWMLYVPSHLGYGAAGKSYIPPDSPLVFKVELVSVTPGAPLS